MGLPRLPIETQVEKELAEREKFHRLNFESSAPIRHALRQQHRKISNASAFSAGGMIPISP